MSDNDKSDGSRTESDSSQGKQRKPLERVEKDAKSFKKDSRRSTHDRAGADRYNGPLVTRDAERREDAHSSGASAPTKSRQPTKTDATEWHTVENKRKKDSKGKEPLSYTRKTSRISQEGFPSPLANVEAVMPQFDPTRHDGTTVFVGAYRGGENDIRKIIHALGLDNMLCI
eukprot:8448328-Pyramimonas_sp.AAC.1